MADGDSTGKYRAVLLSICKAGQVTEDLRPFVAFRATFEKRDVTPTDDIAIFNVYGTSSHFVVFLDEGKTMDDFEEEILPYNAIISAVDRQRIATELETKALLKEAMGD